MAEFGANPRVILFFFYFYFKAIFTFTKERRVEAVTSKLFSLGLILES